MVSRTREGHQGAVHGGEQASTEDTDAHHVEGVHQDVVLGLEHQHEVEGARDAQGHAVREGTLTEGVDQNTAEAAATGAL